MFEDMYQRPGIRFSIWLRRRFDMSHFTIAAYSLMPLLIYIVVAIHKGDSWYARLGWAVLFIFNLNAVRTAMQFATKHNRPHNVEAIVPFALSLVFATFCVVSVIVSVLRAQASYNDIAVSFASVFFYLSGIPGFKIDHSFKKHFMPNALPKGT